MKTKIIKDPLLRGNIIKVLYGTSEEAWQIVNSSGESRRFSYSALGGGECFKIKDQEKDPDKARYLIWIDNSNEKKSRILSGIVFTVLRYSGQFSYPILKKEKETLPHEFEAYYLGEIFRSILESINELDNIHFKTDIVFEYTNPLVESNTLEVIVSLDKELGGASGIYNSKKNRIILKKTSETNLSIVLFHELVHYVQHFQENYDASLGKSISLFMRKIYLDLSKKLLGEED